MRAFAISSSVTEVSRTNNELVTTLVVDPSEPVLVGHFPGFPIFPGVCLVECAHQTALMALPGKPVLVAIERVRFLAPVYPGDQIWVQLEIGDDGLCSARVYTKEADAAIVKLRYGIGYDDPQEAQLPDVVDSPMGIADIKRLLPHRYPMLLIDQVDRIGPGDELVATKTITANEPCYARLSDPDSDHTYPEVLLAESWCQAAGVLAVRENPNPNVLTGMVTLFGAISKLKLLAPVYPGQVLKHHVRALKILSDGAVLEGETLVDGVPVMTVGQIIIALRPASNLTALPAASASAPRQ